MATFEQFLSTISVTGLNRHDTYVVLNPDTSETVSTIMPKNHKERRKVRRQGGISLSELARRIPNSRS